MVNIGDPWKEPPSLQLQTFWSCLFYFFLFFSQSTSINSVEHESIRDAWVVNSKTGAPTKRMRNSRARPFSLSFFLSYSLKLRREANRMLEIVPRSYPKERRNGSYTYCTRPLATRTNSIRYLKTCFRPAHRNPSENLGKKERKKNGAFQ